MHGLHVFSKSCLKTRTSCMVCGGPDPSPSWALFYTCGWCISSHFFHLLIWGAVRDWNTRRVISISVCWACQHPQVALHSPCSGKHSHQNPFPPSLHLQPGSRGRAQTPVVAQGHQWSFSCQALHYPMELSYMTAAKSIEPLGFTVKWEANQAWKLNLHARLRKL